MKTKIGIVGQGFVGSAIREGLKNYHQVHTFDIKKELRTCDSLNQLVNNTDIIFCCLPTPMRKDGSCDTRLVSSVVSEINELVPVGKSKIIIIKSTVPPGTTAKIDEDNPNIEVIFSPEFLTEANSIDDFKNQTRIILGGSRPATTRVKTMFRKAFPSTTIVKTGSRTAEMIKYFTNCFLASKVIFANEMKQICDSNSIDYDKVVEYALYDDRIGNSHLAVPGPDGDVGFGGHCFPKDLKAMITQAESTGIDPVFLKSVWSKNQSLRNDKDWEKMSGRAVSED